MPEIAQAKGRSGWVTVTLGDVVEVINDYWDRDATIPERLVAGEHIDGGELRVHRWGMTDDDLIPPTFNRRFREGDALLHSRNIDKVAQPDFGGITGEKIFILRSRDEEVLLQDLIPYLVASDRFRRYAESRWAGSTNKFLNKTPLMQYEFDLPPLDEQRRIARVLIAAEDYQDALRDLSARGTSSRASLVDHRMRGLTLGRAAYHERVGRYFDGWGLVPLGELLAMAQYGLSESLHSEGQYPVLRMMNLEEGKATADDLKYLDLADAEFEAYRLVSGDVLFNRTNSYELVGRTGVYDMPGDFVFASYLVRLRTDADRLLPEYLCAFLRAPIGRRQVMSFATRGVSQANVNASNLKRVLVPVPPIGYQKEVVDLLGALDARRRETSARLLDARKLSARVINRGLVR